MEKLLFDMRVAHSALGILEDSFMKHLATGDEVLERRGQVGNTEPRWNDTVRQECADVLHRIAGLRRAIDTLRQRFEPIDNEKRGDNNNGRD